MAWLSCRRWRRAPSRLKATPLTARRSAAREQRRAGGRIPNDGGAVAAGAGQAGAVRAEGDIGDLFGVAAQGQTQMSVLHRLVQGGLASALRAGVSGGHGLVGESSRARQ
jgi:hypothetical protein